MAINLSCFYLKVAIKKKNGDEVILIKNCFIGFLTIVYRNIGLSIHDFVIRRQLSDFFKK